MSLMWSLSIGARMVGWRGLEAAPVLGGSDRERSQEGAAHGLCGPEAARLGNDADRLPRLLQAPARGLQAHALHIPRGCHARFGAKGAREVSRAHVSARGHRVDGVLA